MAYFPVHLNSKNARGNSWRKKSCGQQLVEVNLLPVFSSVFTNMKETKDLRERERDVKQADNCSDHNKYLEFQQRDLLPAVGH